MNLLKKLMSLLLISSSFLSGMIPNPAIIAEYEPSVDREIQNPSKGLFLGILPRELKNELGHFYRSRVQQEIDKFLKQPNASNKDQIKFPSMEILEALIDKNLISLDNQMTLGYPFACTLQDILLNQTH